MYSEEVNKILNVYEYDFMIEEKHYEDVILILKKNTEGSKGIDPGPVGGGNVIIVIPKVGTPFVLPPFYEFDLNKGIDYVYYIVFYEKNIDWLRLAKYIYSEQESIAYSLSMFVREIKTNNQTPPFFIQHPLLLKEKLYDMGVQALFIRGENNGRYV